MKKEYQTPDIHIEEYEIENIQGNLCNNGGYGYSLLDEGPIIPE